MKINTDEITKLLTEGELKEAVEKLVIGVKYSDYETDVALLSLRFNTLSRELHRETITASDANIERNKITVALLDVVDKIREDFVKNDVMFQKILFFETPKIIMPKKERVYFTTFKKEEMRYLGWELDMKYPKMLFPYTFLVEWQILKPSGAHTAKLEKEMKLSADWSGSFHNGTWGSEKVGSWQPDNYTLQITIDDRIVITERFTIV